MQLRYYGANATLSSISTTSFNPIAKIDKKDETEKTMTEDKSNQKPKNLTPSVEKTVTTPAEKKIKKAPISKLSIVAILLTIGLGGFIFYHGHQQAQLQQKTISSLQNEILALQQKTEQIHSLEERVNNVFTEQQINHGQFSAALTTNSLNIDKLNNRLASISNINVDNWLISEANYLIHLAGRKIWNDQDYTTALSLLKNADANLAKANDASLLPARQAISKDIASLSKISMVDSDGLIISIMRLSDELTDLPLLSNYKDIDLGMTQYKEVPPEQAHSATTQEENSSTKENNSVEENTSISSSIADWSTNLLKNYNLFLQKFISVKKMDKQDDFNACLTNAGQDEKQILRCQLIRKPISLDESFYLRENIRSRLLIAAQAIPRHQDLIYQRSLNDVDIWVNAYFDDDNASVKAFLNELDELQNQSISDKNVPEKLASSDELQKLMQSHVLSFLVK